MSQSTVTWLPTTAILVAGSCISYFLYQKVTSAPPTTCPYRVNGKLWNQTLLSGDKYTDPPTDPSGFPLVQPNGSLLLAWQVKNKRVLMVGGGNVAAGRILNLLNANALITLICPSSGLNPETAHYLTLYPESIVHYDRNFEPSDVEDPSLVMALTAIDDPEESTTIWKACKAAKIPVNVADVPPECDFYFGSVHRDGPLQIMVSTNGNGPRIAAAVRKKIAATLPASTGRAITRVGELRQRLRKVAPGSKQGPKRMEWMSRVCDEWTLDELCEMEQGDMDALLRSFEKGDVPTFEQAHELAMVLESIIKGEQVDDAKETKTSS